MHFCDCAINAIRISDPFLMVSFDLSRRVCVAILQCCSSCRRARATLQLATVMHAISASLLGKIDSSESECADGNLLTKNISYCVM